MALSKWDPSRVIVLDFNDFRINANVCSPLKSPAIEPDDEDEDLEFEREMNGAEKRKNKIELRQLQFLTIVKSSDVSV
jgi:hypothetical protein